MSEKTQTETNDLFVPVTELISGLDMDGLVINDAGAYSPQTESALNGKKHVPGVIGLHTFVFSLFGNGVSGLGLTCSNVYYQSKEMIEKVIDQLEGQIVVGLGAGRKPFDYFIADWAKAAGFVAVEPNFANDFSTSIYDAFDPVNVNDYRVVIPDHDFNNTPLAVVQEDMLSFLKRLADNSVSLFCSGLDEYVLPDLEYRTNVGEEIVRVLDPKGVYLGDAYMGHIRPTPKKLFKRIAYLNPKTLDGIMEYRKGETK